MSGRVMAIKRLLLDTGPVLCPERAGIITRAYAETEGEPPILRRAKALSAVLREIPITISEGELIVGTQAGRPRGVSLFPESSVDWLEQEVLDGPVTSRDRRVMSIPPETRAALPDVIRYWRGRTLKDAVMSRYPGAVRRAREAGLFTVTHLEDSGLGHVLLDYPRILRDGLKGVRAECEKGLESAGPSSPPGMKRVAFWQAAMIALDAVTAFAHRHAVLAGRLAMEEADPRRREELLGIEQACLRVPDNPPETFHEALQSIWFAHLVVFIEQNGSGDSLGRLDQYLYPFYKRDVDRGDLTRDRARELICLFYLKLFDLDKARPLHRATQHAGLQRDQNITLGGVDSRGRDCTNELTEIFLEAEAETRMPEPQLSLRISRQTPEGLLQRAAAVIRLGGGKPQLVSDPTAIESLLSRGIPLDRARDYCPIGCIELSTIGCWNRCNGGYLNIPKVLELAFNSGRDPRTGVQVGPETPDPRTFRGMEDLMRAFRKQMRSAVTHLATVNNIVDETNARMFPYPYISSLIPGCVPKGLDVTWGGADYNWTGVLGIGIANVADSLEAVDELVFRQGRLTMDGLLDALRNDFADPVTRGLCLKAPKYGNDIDSVDERAAAVFEIFADEVEEHSAYHGGRFVPGAYSLTSNISLGQVTGATPDGRRAGQPFAEGISPSQGADTNGPTAVMRSVGKIDLVRATNGVILNQRLSPAMLKTDQDVNKFAALCRAFLLALGGLHVQFNVVSTATLREAQKDPAKYRSLLIRVTGYSAFFIDLDPEVQEDIIARTEQGGY